MGIGDVSIRKKSNRLLEFELYSPILIFCLSNTAMQKMASFALASSLRSLLTPASRSLTGRRLHTGALAAGFAAVCVLPLRRSPNLFPNVATGTPSLQAASCRPTL